MGQTLVDVGIFCERLLEVAQSFDDRGYLPDQRTISAVGSSFVDIVVDVLGTDRRNELWLRSGCYVTHDHGSYVARSAFERVLTMPKLCPALELLVPVVS
jgi:D-serine dehydratase